MSAEAGEKKWLFPVEGMHDYKGFLCLPECPPRVLQWMEDTLRFEQGDVLITCYPASGIRWLQETVWLMHNPDKLDSKEEKESIGKRIPFIEHQWFDIDPDELLRDSTPPRVFKTHVPADFIEHHFTQNKVKVISWMADPRPTLVRYWNLYKHEGKRFQDFPDIEWDLFFKLFEEKQLFEGDWFKTVQSYIKYRDNPNFLFMKFEDAEKDIVGACHKIAKFLALDGKLSADTVEKIAHANPFDRTPDWTKQFTAEQLAHYNKRWAEDMPGTPYK